MFSKSLIILFAAISIANVALASPHIIRRHHHALSARGQSVARNVSGQLENRALRKRCRSRPPPSQAPVNVAQSTSAASTSTTSTTPKQQQPPPPASTSSTQQAAPTQGNDDGQNQGGNQGSNNGNQGGNNDNNGGNNGSNNGGSNSGGSSSGGGVGDLPSFAVGTLSGEGTYYNTGLVACGDTYQDTDNIVAVSQSFFDIWPGAGANPNLNPLCNKMIRAHYQGKSVDLKIVDRCTGCAKFDIDMTPTAFAKLADLGVGRLTGVTWEFI